MKKKSIIERFWEKVNILYEDDCWDWMASLRNKWGYGGFNVGIDSGKRNNLVVASRFAYILSSGNDVSEGKIVCHTCDNPLCCNPNHLYLGTDEKNTLDKVERGRSMRGIGYKKNNTSSKYVGVHLYARKWVASITVNMKKMYLGRFLVEEDAAIAYNLGALHYFGSNAKLNSVEMKI